MKRRTALVLVWTLPSAVFLAIAAVTFAAYRIPPPVRLTEVERRAVLTPLRDALDGNPVSPCTLTSGQGPIVVSVWLDGKLIERIEGNAARLAEAVDDVAHELPGRFNVKGLRSGERARARLQVDVIVGHAPLGRGSWLGSLALPGVADVLALNPGVEGIGVDADRLHGVVLPHELAAMRLLSTNRPSAAMPEFTMGVDLRRIAMILGQRVGTNNAVPRDALYRFRTDTFVEPPRPQRDRTSISLQRGIPEAPALTAATLREAALAGGRYLVAHLAPNGRYIYEHDLSTGVKSDPAHGAYSMPRHAGTTYFLAELYRITKEEWLREPIERAFAHLAELLSSGRCASKLADGTEIDCVIDKNERVAHLGSTALTVVALVEYQRATGDARYLPLATKFASWILHMQRPDGSFRHLYDVKAQRYDDKTEMFYYSGEAALALARMHAVTGDRRYADAAARGLDWLVDWYDFFIGGFMYGEEHWTCIAAEAIWPASKRDKYREFCDGYGAFLRAQQPLAGEHPDQDDLAGAYNVTPFVAPFNTPAGSRTEAMISAYLLDVHHGHGDPALRNQIRLALQYLLGQQIRAEGAFNVIGEGLGGMPASPVDRSVRIDYVQHVCSAMIRASEWIDSPAP